MIIASGNGPLPVGKKVVASSRIVVPVSSAVTGIRQLCALRLPKGSVIGPALLWPAGLKEGWDISKVILRAMPRKNLKGKSSLPSYLPMVSLFLLNCEVIAIQTQISSVYHDLPSLDRARVGKLWCN